MPETRSSVAALRRSLLPLTLAVALVAGCRLVPTAIAPPSRPKAVPAYLTEPIISDWSIGRVSSPAMAQARSAAATRLQAQRRVQAFPTIPAAWAGGLSLQTTFGAAAGDTVPNGPAAVYTGIAALANSLFFLTAQGRFIKVNQANPAVKTVLPLGRAFSRTQVTLSPGGSRAYLLADDGTLFIVDTQTMVTLATRSVAGGYGIAPMVDPFQSGGDDSGDQLYVADNGGNVTRFSVVPTTVGGPVTVTTLATYAVATGISPLYGELRKFKASPIVLNGQIFVGDTAGRLNVYDTATPANSRAYSLGAPVDTMPALELQDNTYSLTDPAGNPVAVPFLSPIYAFVTAGASCAWIDLYSNRVTFSQGLRIDDNATNTKYGRLLNYNYRAGGTVQNLVAVDGGNINTETPDVDLPGVVPARNWSNDLLVPALTNTRGAQGSPQGGPVVSYLRWHSPTTPTGTDVVNQATMRLWPATNPLSGVADVLTTSPTYTASATNWSSDQLTNANRPLLGLVNVGTPVGFAMFGQNAFYNTGTAATWDVTPAFPVPLTDYALAMSSKTTGADVLWPEGPHAPTFFEQLFSSRVDAVKFRNNALNANATGYGGNNDQRPILSLSISATKLPTPSIETPPMVDSWNKKVYVFYTNAVYEIDFSTPARFSDTVAGQAYTLFNLAYYGDTANGGGAAYRNNSKYVDNYTAPLPNFDLSALYVVSRYPNPDVATPTTWRYAVSKLNLPLSATGNRLVAGSPTFNGLAADASNYMVLDAFANPYTTGGGVYLGMGNGRILQYQP